MEYVIFILVILFRSLVPLTLFRWPFLGGLLCILADASDVMLFEKFGSGPLTDALYHNFDKFFDIYYLSFEAFIAWRWKDRLAGKVAVGLFCWRLIGFVFFELSTLFGHTFRPIFLLTPNIFENFFLLYLVIRKFTPSLKLTRQSLIIFLLIAGIPKLIQEYIMHFAYPDKTWYFLRDNIFFFLYK